MDYPLKFALAASLFSLICASPFILMACLVMKQDPTPEGKEKAQEILRRGTRFMRGW